MIIYKSAEHKLKISTVQYTMKTDNVEAVREQAKYEVGIEKFLAHFT